MGFNMKYDVKKDYLTVGSNKRPGNKIDVGFVVAHDTGNPGSTAQGNVNYYKRSQFEHANWPSAHLFVDDKNIIECVPALTGKAERAYHVIYDVTTDNKMYGDDANDIAIGVELCWGGKIDQDEAYKRYLWVIAYICYKYKLNPAKAIVGHKILDPGRKVDPHNALSKMGISYEQFLKDVVAEYNECTGENTKAASLSIDSESYVIKKGDTFWGIANEKGLDVNKLMSLNPGMEAKGLQPGQVINLKPVTKSITYKIKKGDILSQLAVDYGVSLDSIMELNPKVDPHKLQIGQSIKLPASAKLKAAPKPKKSYPAPVRPWPGKDVKIGSRGRDVEAIQRALGYSGHAVDGIFGKNTANSVVNYQKRFKLSATGVVDYDTWNTMF